MTGYCIETDGVSGYVKFAGAFLSSNIPDSFTLMATIKFLETNTTNSYRPIGISNVLNIGINANQYRPFVSTNMNSKNKGTSVATLSGTVSRNIWVKLCLIVDFNDDRCKLFVDNNKLYEYSLPAGSTNLFRDATDPNLVDLLVGSLLSNELLDRPMKLRVCDLKLFNRAFTDFEGQNYVEKCDILTSDLVLYSVFNEVVGTKVINYAENFSSCSGELIGNAKYVQDNVPFDNIPTLVKYLVVDETEVKHWNSTNSKYEKIGELPLNKRMFQEYGQSVVHNERTGISSLKPILARWSNIALNSYSIKQTAIPKGQLVKMASDATFSEGAIVNITNAVVEAENIGSGILKFIVSVDGGVEWKTWDGSAWNIINANNLDDVKARGIDSTTLQAITETQWTSIGFTSKKIRFAWYMEITKDTDVLKLREIRAEYNKR